MDSPKGMSDFDSEAFEGRIGGTNVGAVDLPPPFGVQGYGGVRGTKESAASAWQRQSAR